MDAIELLVLRVRVFDHGFDGGRSYRAWGRIRPDLVWSCFSGAKQPPALVDAGLEAAEHPELAEAFVAGWVDGMAGERDVWAFVVEQPEAEVIDIRRTSRLDPTAEGNAFAFYDGRAVKRTARGWLWV